MIRAEFNRIHGVEWHALKLSRMYADYKSVLDDESPANNAHKLPLESLNGTLAATMAGFSKCRAIGEELGADLPPEEDEPTFSVSDEERYAGQDAPASDLPPMPPPTMKRRTRIK